MKVQNYPVTITQLQPADGTGYAAIVPDLPGCISDGETVQEALDNVSDAITCWMEAAAEIGREVPQPSAQRQLA